MEKEFSRVELFSSMFLISVVVLMSPLTPMCQDRRLGVGYLDKLLFTCASFCRPTAMRQRSRCTLGVVLRLLLTLHRLSFRPGGLI